MHTHTTARLCLTGFFPAAASALCAILTDAQTVGYTHFGTITPAAIAAWYDDGVRYCQQPAPDAYNHVITLRTTGTVIGWIGIGAASHPESPGERDFGYVIGRAYWNQGYASEALAAVLAYEFAVRQTPVVTATHDIRNGASGRVMQKNNMVCVAHRPDTDNDGLPTTECCYRISAAEYQRGTP
jgi:ribosomal-protein-alanine N-acetyltransferase